MTIPGRSWIVPMSMTLVLAGGCSTVDQVTGMFGGSGRPDDGRAQAGRSFVGERAAALDGDLARLRQTQKDRADATGRLKGYVEARTGGLWDCAGGLALCRAAGLPTAFKLQDDGTVDVLAGEVFAIAQTAGWRGAILNAT